MTSARDDLTGGADALSAIAPDGAVEEVLDPLGRAEAVQREWTVEQGPAVEEIRSLRAELEEVIRENIERRQASRALDREVVQLRAMLAEAERQMGNIRQTFIYRIGEIIVSARTWKGLRQLPRRLIALRRSYLEKRGLLATAGTPRASISERLHRADEAMKILASQGIESAVAYVRSAPTRDVRDKARALLELAHAIYLQDPARAASLAAEAGAADPLDSRLRALVLSLFDHGEIDAPALILSTLSETLNASAVDRTRRETILAQERQLASPLKFPPRAAAQTSPARVAVVASRSLPHHIDADAFRAQAVMEAARDAGLEAWLITPPGYQYPSTGGDEPVHRTLGITQIIRMPPVTFAAGIFDKYIADAGSVLAREFVRRGVTRVHAIGDVPWVATACWAARETGAAFTLDVGEVPALGSHVDADWVNRQRFRSGLTLFAETARSADHVIVRSHAVADACCELDFLHDAEVIPDSIPAELQRASEAEIADVRDILGLTNEKIIGVFEVLDLDKGLFDLVDALPIVRKVEPDTVVVLLGAGRGVEALRQRAAVLGVADRVFVPSDAERRKIVAHLSAFAVAVFPKRRAFLPGLAAPFELQAALAFGTPIVAVANAWASEWITDGVTGLVVEAGDTVAIASAITKLLGDPETAARLGAAGRDLARQRADRSAIDPAIAGAFRQAATATAEARV